MTTTKMTQSFSLTKENVQTAISEFVEKRFGKGGPVKVDVGVRTKTVGYGLSEHDTHVVEISATREVGLPAEVTRAMEGPAIGYDPIKDEKREFSFEEFVETASHELQQYKVALGGQNDFTRGKHTWDTWFRQFHEYMSW